MKETCIYKWRCTYINIAAASLKCNWFNQYNIYFSLILANVDIPSNDPNVLSKLDLIPFFVCYKNKQIIIMFVKFIDKKATNSALCWKWYFDICHFFIPPISICFSHLQKLVNIFMLKRCMEVNNVIVKLPTVIFTDCENLLISNFMDPVSLFI